jgi:DNA repair exonuclease SbcCD ATPase subunit
MDVTFSTHTTRTERDKAHEKIIEKLQEEASSIRIDDVEAYTINKDIISTYKSINEKIDVLKKKAESRSEVKASKDDDKKMNKLKLTQDMLKIKYSSNVEMKQICEKKIDKIDNDIEEMKESYETKEADIRNRNEKKIEAIRRKIEELEKDIINIEEDTENKIKVLDKDKRKSIDKKIEDKEAASRYIDEVLNKRQEEYETQITNVTEEYDTLSNNAKLCLLTSDIKIIEESKKTIKDKLSSVESQLEVYTSTLPKLEQLRKKYFVDDDDYDITTFNYIDNYTDTLKEHINYIKSYPEKLKLLLEEINKII